MLFLGSFFRFFPSPFSIQHFVLDGMRNPFADSLSGVQSFDTFQMSLKWAIQSNKHAVIQANFSQTKLQISSFSVFDVPWSHGFHQQIFHGNFMLTLWLITQMIHKDFSSRGKLLVRNFCEFIQPQSWRYSQMPKRIWKTCLISATTVFGY